MRKLIAVLLAFAGFAANATAQNRVITGRVSDDRGQSIPGISVTAGTRGGTTTDQNGTYSITVAPGTRSLIFTGVNYALQERSIGSGNTVDVVMVSTVSGLSEVVVVGYGTQQRKAFTGSSAPIDVKKFSNLLTPSVDKQLAGRATGVQVTNASGLVNQPARIRIRGTNSLSQIADPLVVIDNIPVITGNLAFTGNSNALGDINPSDIENIEVLKDGSATAIYGSRAANGVILITTKKGAKGQQARMNLETFVGFANPLKRFRLLNAQEFVMISNEKRANANQLPLAYMDAAGTNTDWQGVVFNKNAPITNTTLSLTGGGEKTSYYFSVNYSNQKGVIVSNFNRSYRVRLNLEHELNKVIRIGNNVTLSRQEDSDQQNGINALSGAVGASLRLLPNISPYNPANPTGYNINYPISNTIPNGPNLAGVDDGWTNQAFVLNNNKFTSDKYRIINNTFIEIAPVKGLRFRSQFSPDIFLDYSLLSYDNRHGDGYGTFAGGTNGLSQNASQNVLRYTFQNFVNYNLTLKGGHNFFLTGGHEIQKQNAKFIQGQMTNVADVFFAGNNVITNSAAIQNVGGNFVKTAFESVFARFNYDYKGRYFLQASVRRDGISALAADKRYGTFPGASVGWRPSEEKFWKENSFLSKWVNEFKIKASYAEVGNTLTTGLFTGNTPYLAQTFGPAPYGNIGGVALNFVGTPALSWESSAKYDIGGEVSVWGDRFRITADYFRNDVSDLVLNVPTPLSAGVPGNVIPQNIAQLVNKGYEVALQANIIRRKNFSWEMNLNYSQVRNRIKQLYRVNGKEVPYISVSDGTGTYNLIRPGDPVNILYGVQYAGVNTSNGNPMYFKADGRLVQHNIAPGTPTNGIYYFANSMSDPILANPTTLTFDDRVNLGQGIPVWFGGLGTTLTYKGFTADILFRYSGGNKIMNKTSQEALFSQSFHNNGREILNRWTAPGQVTDVPRLYYGQSNAINQVQIANSRFVEDGDYLRLQNVTLSYTIDGRTFPKFQAGFIRSVRFYVQGQNLAVWTKYKGADPDNVTALGIDAVVSPQIRIFSTGLNIGF